MIYSAGLASRRLFVDSSAFYADVDPRDGRHVPAVKAFRHVVADSRPLVTSNLVLAETHALILRRLGRHTAAAWLDRTGALNVVFATEEEDGAAREIIARYADKEFSYTDAVSFAIMERLGISTAFAFDDDFRQYGLDVIP